MTDLASLLQPDKGQAATALQLVDKEGFEAWLKAQPARARQAAEAQGFKGEGFQLAILPGERDEWSAVLGVADVESSSAWCLAKAAESLPEGTLSGRRARARGRPCSAGCSASIGSTATARRRKGRARASCSPTSRRGSTRPSRSPKRPSWSATWSTSRPAISAPPSCESAAAGASPTSAARRSSSPAGKALDEGYPMVAAVGRAAAQGREPRLIELEWGDQRHPEARHRRQGRLLRFGRARHQAVRRHAADEEGYGRRGPRARASPG